MTGEMFVTLHKDYETARDDYFKPVNGEKKKDVHLSYARIGGSAACVVGAWYTISYITLGAVVSVLALFLGHDIFVIAKKISDIRDDVFKGSKNGSIAEPKSFSDILKDKVRHIAGLQPAEDIGNRELATELSSGTYLQSAFVILHSMWVPKIVDYAHKK
ncbi:MAG: hypothetical protein H0W88_12300 [Parachlamydiaceae bacterium]|nr:hypothetical protein [Parachlamydiaceae bacterium]